MEWKTVIGDLAVITTVLLFLSGISICRKIWENRNTVGISSLPFLTAFVSCTLWLYYGFLKDDGLLEYVNLFGLFAQVFYIGFYLYMSPAKTTMQKKVGLTFVSPLVMLVTLKYFSFDTEQLTKNVGLLSCFVGLVFAASPLSTVVLVFRTQSTASMPFPLITLSCLQSFLWFIYGVLVEDTFIQIPNLLGTTITMLQLFLFVVFYGRAKFGVFLFGRNYFGRQASGIGLEANSDVNKK